MLFLLIQTYFLFPYLSPKYIFSTNRILKDINPSTHCSELSNPILRILIFKMFYIVQSRWKITFNSSRTLAVCLFYISILYFVTFFFYNIILYNISLFPLDLTLLSVLTIYYSINHLYKIIAFSDSLSYCSDNV